MEADARDRQCQRQAGETLVESLIAIAIVALVGLVAYSGLQTALRSSGQHKESAVAETLLRTAAERLQDPEHPYSDLSGCPIGDVAYQPIPVAEYHGSIDPIAYPINVSVSFWDPPEDGDPLEPQFLPLGSCPSADAGLQQVTLSIETPSGFTESLTILKRRN
jgi:hypothetical protein